MEPLRARLARRLQALAVARPDLERAVALQQTLLSRQIDLLELFRDSGVPSLSLPAGYLAAKLKHGIPILHGEPVPLPSKLLELSVREFCGHLAGGSGGDLAAAVARALDERTLDAAALVSACFGRDQRRVRVMAAQHGLSPDIAWLIAELALAPFAHLLQTRAAGRAEHAAAESLAAWNHGFCFACGSWPALIEAAGGRHLLRCSFCAAGWALSPYRCLYCGEAGEAFVTAATDPAQPGRRLQLCGACGGYMKVVETEDPIEFPLVAVEDLASMDLDLAAIERRYLRPPLPDIRKTAAAAPRAT